MWAKFDCGAAGGADAYAEKDFTLPSEFWAEVDVYIPTSTLTSCDGGDLRGATADLLNVGIFDPTVMYAEDTDYPHGDGWQWESSFGPGSGSSVTQNSTQNLKVHVVGATPSGSPKATVTWYVDGVLLNSDIQHVTNEGVILGGLLSSQCTCEWYFFTNFKIGTTNGGSDVFFDDFSSGDFSNWTSTTGSCTVVSAPSSCGTIPPSIEVSPISGCHNTTVTITGSDFAPSSLLTVTYASLPVAFSEATSDGSGNVSGTFVVPYGIDACTTCGYSVFVEDGVGNTATVSFTLCCPRSADSISLISQFGPTFTPDVDISNSEPLDYIHHDASHWAVAVNLPTDLSIFTTFPPSDFKPLTVFQVPDDGSSVSSFDVDTDFCWQFDLHGDGGDLIFGGNNGTFIGKDVFEFVSWSKPISDARFASDGTNLWLVVLTEATIPYPYITSDDSQPGSGTAQPSQDAQFIDLSTLTSGFTTFYTGGAGAPAGYSRLHRLSFGAINFFNDNPPGSDGGDSWTGYWTIPRLRVYSLNVGAAIHIGNLDAIYYPGETAANGVISGAGSAFGAPTLYNKGQLSRLLSGVSVCASPNEAGVCHVVFAEGGAYGRYGASGGNGPLSTWAVWDGNAPDINYRINHSRWDSAGMMDEFDLSSSHIDRSNWFFTYDSGFGSAPYGYTWSDSADLAWSQVFQARNDSGTPALFLSNSQTTPNVSPPNGDPDPHGNPWLDNSPYYTEGTLRAYDISGGTITLEQTLDSSLLPTLAEVQAGDPSAVAPDVLNVFFSEGFNSLAGIALSNLYDDPLLSRSPVYLFGIRWTNAASGFISEGFYRIPADLSATFDILDGIRAVGYSILVSNPTAPFNPGSNNSRRFISDQWNLWSNAAPGPFQLDRQCATHWETWHSIAGDGIELDFYWDGGSSLYSVGLQGALFSIAKTEICRRCLPCGCIGTGLHVWQVFG